MAGAGKMSGGGNYVTDSFTDIIVPSNLDLGKIFINSCESTMEY